MYNISIHLILLILSVLFAVFIFVLGKIFAPGVIENQTKLSNYECGNLTEETPKKSEKANFAVFAILFPVFVSENFLLFPFALTYGKLKSFVFLQAVVFILVMILSLAYSSRRNLLRFK